MYTGEGSGTKRSWDQFLLSPQENVMRKKRKLAVLHMELGKDLQSSGEVEESIEHFEMSIQSDPSFAPPRYERLKSLLQDDEPKAALNQAQQIYDIDPNFMDPQFLNEIVPEIIKRVEVKNKSIKRTPVTILTGFLGAGKTTLLNRILSENHGMKIAVIENEYGAIGVDEKLVVANKFDDEQVVEIMNGCVCCTVREDLAKTLAEMKKQYIDTGKIEYIILETTGMANPGPVLQTFFVHPDIQEWATLDAWITVCDGTNIVNRLNEEREEGTVNEAVEQVCYADKVLLNKVDLCTSEQLAEATNQVRVYNAQCEIQRVQLNNKDIPFDQLLNQKAFSIEKALDINAGLLQQNQFKNHKHDKRIGTFSYRMEAEMLEETAEDFLQTILRENGENIYRMKGFLAIDGEAMKYVFHSVGMMCNIVPLEPWKPGEKRECVFVIIGKHLQQKWLQDTFMEAAVTKPKTVEQIQNQHNHDHSHEGHSHGEESGHHEKPTHEEHQHHDKNGHAEKILD